MPATSTSLTVPVTSFTATSTVYPIAGYLITQSSSVPNATGTGWTAAAPSSFIFNATGTQTAYAWVEDVYGNMASSSQSVTITIPSNYPTLSTSTASSIATSTVTLNGTITSIGLASATAEGFNYGTSTAYGLVASTTGSFGAGSFSKNITGLSPNTTYHFQAFATNSYGTGTSTDATFTTNATTSAPTLSTSTASSVSTSTVTLSGTIASIGNATATVEGFNYGTSTAYGLTASTTGSFATGTFSQNLTGLLPSTTYHFQAFATNSAGTGTSTDATFITAGSPVPPTLGTSTASSIATSTVTLNGIISSLGNATATVEGFNYGTSTAYGLTASTTGNFGTGSFNQGITGLLPNTAYHFQAFATNSVGTGTSTDATFMTNTTTTVDVYYSVGQSTSTNLVTGGSSTTVTITSGAAVFSVAQTGNIGVGDQVTYASGTVAYISGKSDTTQLDWSLVTATGSTPANITNATVTSINRAFASLSAALNTTTGFANASHLATSSLVGANAIVNLSCYYDTGPDTTSVYISGSLITSTSTYINIYTPNNTSTQANFSQRHTGKWASNAYQLIETNGPYGLEIETNYVRVVGLQVETNVTATDTQNYPEGIVINDAQGGYIVLDSNIIAAQSASSTVSTEGITVANSTPTTGVFLNNIVYETSNTASSLGITGLNSGYIYNNTVYNMWRSYEASSTVPYKNDIAQSDTQGYVGTGSASSTNNISDHTDAPGSNPEDLATVLFASTSTQDFHLSVLDTKARGNGANLTNDPNYPFTYDIDGQTRPSSGAWDIGAAQWEAASATPPTITAFTMPATSTSLTVPVTSFTATSTVYPIAGYLITQSSSVPSYSSPNWALTAPSAFTFNGSGIQVAYAWTMDVYGNISSAASQTVAITPFFSPVSSSSSFPSTFFGISGWNSFATSSTWPSVPFGAVRLWDDSDEWSQIETASGTYNWTDLNEWLAQAQASGTDVLYTFGRVPTWASSNPSQTCSYNITPGCAAPPSDVDSGDTIWKTFVTALVEHSLASPTAHIKYYEIWNEPNCTTDCTWTGTNAQMVTMARDAYTIIHALDPNALVVGPSPYGPSALSWLQGYYAAGGAPYQDIVAFHTYDNTASQINANAVVPIVNSIQSLMNTYGIGSDPLWTTEGSWGDFPLTNSQQAAFLGQQYLYLWMNHVSRYYWWTWDSPGFDSPLWSSSGGVTAAGTAYGLLDNWLVGSVSPSSPCYQTVDATWYCSLTLADGDPATITWNPNATTTKAVSPAFTTYLTLNNSAVNPIIANTVSVGNGPILLVQNDEVAPIISSFTMPATATSTTVAVTSFSATDSESPVVDYLITESSSTPSSTNPNWSGATPISFTFSGTGTQAAFAWAMDASGNISSAATATVTVTGAPPTLGTSSVSSVSTSTATLNGVVASVGTASATIEGFNYGTSTAYGLVASSTGSFGAGSFSESISTLNPDTTYHFQAFATNSAGTETSTDAAFTTGSVSSGGSGGPVVVVPSGGEGTYIPPVTTSSTASTGTNSGAPGATSTLSSLTTSTAGLRSLLASLQTELNNLLAQASAQGIAIPGVASPSSFSFKRNLTVGSRGSDVVALQHYLNTHGFPVVATPGDAGSLGNETQYFGSYTQEALAKFQMSAHIAPAAGYFGPITRAYVNSH
jgi:hypothetical protein